MSCASRATLGRAPGGAREPWRVHGSYSTAADSVLDHSERARRRTAHVIADVRACSHKRVLRRAGSQAWVRWRRAAAHAAATGRWGRAKCECEQRARRVVEPPSPLLQRRSPSPLGSPATAAAPSVALARPARRRRQSTLGPARRVSLRWAQGCRRPAAEGKAAGAVRAAEFLGGHGAALAAPSWSLLRSWQRRRLEMLSRNGREPSAGGREEE